MHASFGCAVQKCATVIISIENMHRNTYLHESFGCSIDNVQPYNYSHLHASFGCTIDNMQPYNYSHLHASFGCRFCRHLSETMTLFLRLNVK